MRDSEILKIRNDLRAYMEKMLTYFQHMAYMSDKRFRALEGALGIKFDPKEEPLNEAIKAEVEKPFAEEAKP